MKEPTVTVPNVVRQLQHADHCPWHREGGSTPVGAGPFVLKGQERGVAIDLEAFDRFFKPGLPKLKSIRFVAYADENLRVAALQAGDVDIIDYVPWQAMDAIEKDPKLKLSPPTGLSWGSSSMGGRALHGLLGSDRQWLSPSGATRSSRPPFFGRRSAPRRESRSTPGHSVF